MIIKYIKFKNFASYSNKIHEYTFHDQGSLTLVHGNSGAGKSTLLDVVKFGLYGKVDNKRNTDIPNRFNKNCEVTVEVLLPGGIILKIERGLAPDYFRIYLDGKLYDQAGKKNIQNYLETELLKIPYSIFNNTISLNINDFKSFLNMTPNDKRSIIDKLFGLEILSNIKNQVKDKIKEIKDDLLSSKSEIQTLERSINTAQTQLEKAKIEQTKIQNEQLQELQIKLKEITEKYEEILPNENKIKNLYEKVTAYKEKVITEIRSIEYEIKKDKEKIDLYNLNVCPTCGSSLETDIHQNKKNEIFEKIKENSYKIETLKTDEQTGLIKMQNDIELLKGKLKTIAETKHELQYEMWNVNTQIKSFENNNQPDYKALISYINETEELLKKVKNNDEKKQQELAFQNIIEEIFGDYGLKLRATEILLPLINHEITHLMKKLNLGYSIVLNSDFKATITHLGYVVEPEQLSTGERKRIDFAILIALVKFMKIKHSNLNVLFFDEIFSSVDAGVIYEIIQILSAISKELNLNIFVINHSSMPTELFDRQIEVIKEGYYSKFIITDTIVE